MTTSQLIRDSLRYFWRSHIALALCVATGTAVLAGALVVGDSMRGSLRQMTLDRLGRVDFALRAGRFFRESLADDIQMRLPAKLAYGLARHDSPLFIPVEPAILARGSAARVNESGEERERVGRAQVWGVRESFWQLAQARHGGELFAGWGDAADHDSVVISESMAHDLSARKGDVILLRVQAPSDIPREAVLGRKDGTVRTLRLKVVGIATTNDMGRFGLEPSQIEPRNAFLPLQSLQESLGVPDRANTILVSEPPNVSATPDQSAARVQVCLAERLRFEDLGLRLRLDESRGYLSLETKRMFLEPVVVDAAERAAQDLQLFKAPTITYLANSIQLVRPDGAGPAIPYSVVAALPLDVPAPLGALTLRSGEPFNDLADDEIVLNTWAADDLNAHDGDQVQLEYYLPEPAQPFETAVVTLRVRGVAEMRGPASDPGLVPEYPGVTDAKRYADWDPPFPMDLKRVRQQDEDYWDKYRATPKAFVSTTTGQRLWSSRFGTWTSIRFAPRVPAAADNNGSPESALAAAESLRRLAKEFERVLLSHMKPEQAGLLFQPVKAQGLAASRGGTDFGQLFLAFSMFLIVSAAILIALVFRLGVERRARQIGLLLAIGIDHVGIRRMLFREGLIVAALGSIAGLAGAVGYGWFVILALRTWWLSAVRTTLLTLHVSPMTLAIGLICGMLLAALAIAGSVRGIVRIPARALLAGLVIDPLGNAGVSTGRFAWSRWIRWLALVIAIALLIAAFLSSESPVLFFASGAAWLVAGLGFLASRLTSRVAGFVRGHGLLAAARLGVRNASRHRGRSLLTAILVACATFVIVAVGANRRAEDSDGQGPATVAGFSLVATSDVPLLHDLNTRAGRAELGIDPDASHVIDAIRVFPFRVKEGEDASCLNLYQPQQPRILGATREMIARGGFRAAETLAKTVDEKQNPWRLLEGESNSNVVPALGDANSVRWILKLGLGKRLAITAEDGRPVELEIVAMLDQSIFQSELVISEANFRKIFPSLAGYSYFLIENAAEPPAGAESQAAIMTVLERQLSDFGFDAMPISERLAEYHAVENTYLSTFQLLGGLGLILGTLGLGAVQLRNVMERRGELALLQAVGFRSGLLAAIVLGESAFLLSGGLFAGALAAFIAVAPRVLSRADELPWISLGGTLLVVLTAGLVSAGAAIWIALRTPLLPALRSE